MSAELTVATTKLGWSNDIRYWSICAGNISNIRVSKKELLLIMSMIM